MRKSDLEYLGEDGEVSDVGEYFGKDWISGQAVLGGRSAWSRNRAFEKYVQAMEGSRDCGKVSGWIGCDHTQMFTGRI